MAEKKMILIVDDEKSVRDVLKEYLESLNYRVEIAEDGMQAIQIAEKYLPDLVITDLLLPKEHGIEVLKFIKDRFFIPVIAISGIYKKEEIHKEMGDLDLDGYFEKPLDFKKLRQCIESILNE